MNFNVIIPTYKSKDRITKLLNELNNQTMKPNKIIIVETISEDDAINNINMHNVIFEKVNKNDFNHGTTRDYFARKYSNDYLVFMTQDALPFNNKLFEDLLLPFSEDADISLVYARQIAYDDAKPHEKLNRSFNYPDEYQVKTRNDIGKYGIKTYFCSNVCAAYRMKDYLDIGGFEHDVKTNEDMFIAYKLINNNKKIVYNSDAKVFHSHNMSLKKQYNRSYVQGYELSKHKEILENTSTKEEGIKLFNYVTKHLIKKIYLIDMIYFVIESFVKYRGFYKGFESK